MHLSKKMVYFHVWMLLQRGGFISLMKEDISPLVRCVEIIVYGIMSQMCVCARVRIFSFIFYVVFQLSPPVITPLPTVLFSTGNLLLGLDFRIVFTIRPRSSTGILLHAGSKQDNYLTIYMKRGKVSTHCFHFSCIALIQQGNSDLELWTYILHLSIGTTLNNFLRII